MKLLKLRFLYFICLLYGAAAWAQDVTVSGTVKDENGLPVPGVSIVVKDTTTGTTTDIDGNYQVNAPSTGTLVFTYISYTTKEVAVNGQSSINVQLEPSQEVLDQVVVVGYGTQKKTVATGAISSIKADQLQNMPVTNIGQSLQGRVSGVTIFQNSGQPGSGATIRVRGVTSFESGQSPLWVVDGVIIDNGGIGVVNQADIESIDVLKDAASTAIYGTRGANGVILVTTKKGKSGKLSVNYNGFAGFSGPSRKLDLLNAEQYATLRNEAYTNGYDGQTAFSLPFANPSAYGKGTNWQDVIFNDNAQRSQHEFSLSGGTEKSMFYASFSMTDQEGIVTSKISQYNRKTYRLNSDHNVTKWLKVGQTLTYTNEKNIGLGNTNGEFGGPLASAINLDPTTPAIVTDPSGLPNTADYGQTYALKDPNGNYYGISPYVQQEMTNPLAYIQTRLGNYSWADNFIGSAYAEITPIEGLKFRTQVSGKLSYYGDESFTPQSYLGPNSNTARNSLFRSSNRGQVWNVENTISYSKLIGDHNFTVLIGQGAYKNNILRGQWTRYYNQPTNDYRDASFSWPTIADDIQAASWTNTPITLSSLFARVNYDYKEKYLLTGIIRRDGSSNFGSNNKYGVFPSFSLGWVPTKEDFWKENNAVNFLKIRGGYGVVGNDDIAQNAFLSVINGGYNYTIGNNGTVAIGNTLLRPSNPDLQWEETSMTNIGFDSTLFQDFSLTVEWYKKETTGMLQTVQIPGYVGASDGPRGNVASMKNTGVEFELGYRKKIGELNLTVNGNLSTLKNTVTSVGPDREFNTGPTVQSFNYPITRSEVGSTYNGFYGFVTEGIFQNQSEINAYTSSDGTVIQPNAQPGDFRWADLNDDGQITADDRKFIGKPLPDFTYGITVNLAYKGFDLTVMGQGVAGNQIFQGLRRLDMINANWQTNALNRWTGEGTSNTYPRLSTIDNGNHNFSNPSTFYLQDGDYFRIKILQLGYSLPQSLIGEAGLDKVRIYATAENLLTFTKYTGYDPEIGGDVMGIDRGYYPQARSFMIGCNLQF
jgi:TonB-dependent starch-binding outer membrane protein SusC